MKNIGKMLKNAQKMQKEMSKMQDEAGEKTYTAQSGGGMVKAVVNGKYEIVSLEIEKEIVDKEDVEMLQDLIIAAVNEALKLVGEEMSQGLSKMTESLGINLSDFGL
jgi:hypothetical protein